MYNIKQLLQKIIPTGTESSNIPYSITGFPVWSIIIGIVIVVLVTTSGFINVYYLNRSHLEIETIHEITSLAQTTQIEFEKQFTLLHYMILENNPEEYRKYFHKFSYQYTIVQNQLFNLKLLLNDYIAIKQRIEEIQTYHKEFSEMLIDEITQYKENSISAYTVYMTIKGKDLFAIESLTQIVSDINSNNFQMINNTKNKFYIFSITSIGIISITAFILIIIIFLIIKKEKQLLLSIGKQLSSFLPAQLVQLILRQEKQEILPIQKKFITVCFSDIQGFTKLTDSIDADVVATILNQYLTEMTSIANKFNGTVDKFIGDGIMIIFGAPLSITPTIQADNAVSMAQEMQNAFQKLNCRWQSTYNIEPLYLRIGIHCGIATVGSFGTAERLTFTAVGKTVNIASRLEKLCPENSILISSDIKQLSPQLKTENVITLTIRGIEKPIEVYTIACNEN